MNTRWMILICLKVTNSHLYAENTTGFLVVILTKIIISYLKMNFSSNLNTISFIVYQIFLTFELISSGNE